MIDEADKFSRMIYTMTLCFDGEKKRKEKIKLGDKLQTNYILYCVTIEFFQDEDFVHANMEMNLSVLFFF